MNPMSKKKKSRWAKRLISKNYIDIIAKRKGSCNG